jgi:hypothetical protein
MKRDTGRHGVAVEDEMASEQTYCDGCAVDGYFHVGACPQPEECSASGQHVRGVDGYTDCPMCAAIVRVSARRIQHHAAR